LDADGPIARLSFVVVVEPGLVIIVIATRWYSPPPQHPREWREEADDRARIAFALIGTLAPAPRAEEEERVAAEPSPGRTTCDIAPEHESIAAIVRRGALFSLSLRTLCVRL
jgi:hypothetical protein